MSDSTIMQYWSSDDFSPRDVQVQALEWIEQQSAKYLILQAPVASGKSHIAITASNFFGGNGSGNAFVLTPQKVLQKQYNDTFDDDVALAVYGKNNFECTNKGCTCDIGALLKPVCKSCPYTEQITQSTRTPNIIMNYQLAFLMFRYHPKFVSATRKLMVIDECHNLEESLINFSASSITRKFCELDLGVTWPTDVDDFASFKKWATQDGYIDNLYSQQEFLEKQVQEIESSRTKMSKEDVKTIRRLFMLDEKVEQINEIIALSASELREHYVFDNGSDAFTIRQLFGKDLFTSILKDRADKFLFMSGTVDGPGFCRDLGIPIEEAAFLSLDSPIPTDNRPVLFLPTIRMNYEWQNDANRQARKAAVDNITKIVNDFHPNDSGIIHTSNFKIAEWIGRELKSFAQRHKIDLIDHVPDDFGQSLTRDEAIARYLHNASRGVRSILISPSCTEGLDLKHDLGRFSIVLKIPYGNLGDKWIKQRMQISKEWYARQALNQTMQAAGRVVRDPEDQGTTYILDESWAYLMSNTKNLIPQWWKDAYHK